MKLQTVTLTGADDSVTPDQLADLSERYPYVEWAILFSQSKTGGPRYPSIEWIDKLAALWGVTELAGETPVQPRKMNLAAHLCGKWVDDVVGGHFSFLDQKCSVAFNRIQLNLGKERLIKVVENPKKLLGTLVASNCGQPIILGGNYRHVEIDSDFFEDSGFYPLFDGSGGRGKLAQEWPKPFYVLGLHWCTPLYCGYAGGLGPDNVVEQLGKIQEVAAEADIWIDMESSLRGDKDCFNLEACEAVLEAAKPWVPTYH